MRSSSSATLDSPTSVHRRCLVNNQQVSEVAQLSVSNSDVRNQTTRVKRKLPDFILNCSKNSKGRRIFKNHKSGNISDIWQPPAGETASQSQLIGKHVQIDLSAEEEAHVLAAISSADAKVLLHIWHCTFYDSTLADLTASGPPNRTASPRLNGSSAMG